MACRWWDGDGGFEVEVDMGPGLPDGPDVDLAELPGLAAASPPPRSPRGLRVSTGNPHVVFFDRFTPDEIRAWGPLTTSCPVFPHGVNAGFAEIMAPGRVCLAVHERGAGFTLACGTGACAAVAAGVRAGLLASDKPVAVTLPGGTLRILHRSADGRLLMTGPAAEVFEGVVELACISHQTP